MKVKITRWIDEIVELPESMFKKEDYTIGPGFSEYSVTNEGYMHMINNDISCIVEMNGKIIAEM